MNFAWVIGGNGLLGTALREVLQTSGVKLFQPSTQVLWNNESNLNAQFSSMVAEFSLFIEDESDWQIYWAAGVGFMGSSREELQAETCALTSLLIFIESHTKLISNNGCIAFSSSAGAVYAGATDFVVSENTAISPTTAYAHEKLEQERLLSMFADKHSKVSILLARVSTLYGSVSRGSKRRGLLTEMARRIVRNQPIQIYVPFDTIRDYITAEDAAQMMVLATNKILGEIGIFIKIIASSHPVTIAEIISIFRKVSRRPPKVVTSASSLSNTYRRQIQFLSVVIPETNIYSRTSMLIGISRVMEAERLSFSTFGE